MDWFLSIDGIVIINFSSKHMICTKKGNQSFLTNMEPYNRLSCEQRELKVELEKSLKAERKAPKPIDSIQI